MKRKKVVPLPRPENMSVADALVVLEQTIIVTCVMQRGIDPNEAYDEWEANKDNLLACSQAIHSILETCGEQLNDLKFSMPAGLAIGGYHVDGFDPLAKDGGFPF